MTSNATPTIVHERLTEIAGSEYVVEQLAEEWQHAEIHVPIADPSSLPEQLRDRVRVSGVDRLHRLGGRRTHAPLLPLFPHAFAHMSLPDTGPVVISHHSAAIAAVHATRRPTVAYVHSPARWAWEKSMRDGEADGRLGRFALSALAVQIRRSESRAAPKLTAVVANSTEVQDRIHRWWGRDSVVIHPPVDTERYTPDPSVEREDFFLLAGRLVPYKRPDLAVMAARRAGVRLLVAGDGRMAAECRALAGEETTFLGRVSDAEMLSLQRRTRALVMPGVEDFGIVPVEAMSCGTPVIAMGSGGALDTVVEGLSGILVDHGHDAAVVEGFAEVMRSFPDQDFDPAAIRKHAERFGRARFRAEMRAVVDAVT